MLKLMGKKIFTFVRLKLFAYLTLHECNTASWPTLKLVEPFFQPAHIKSSFTHRRSLKGLFFFLSLLARSTCSIGNITLGSANFKIFWGKNQRSYKIIDNSKFQ